ncbi:hypothetical protein TRAPUB_2562 [Trametes pubescens]|uniref:Uncharacterized protein n=1 Tax=Trametes pubescens TaxID=154538 RepID=A0A1M2VG51_TRAPU|nr:hypothetical protein TRAPUB_2562 [Trametes pubescens]
MNSSDVTELVTLYWEVLADVVVDLQSVQAVVGRVKSRDQWGIIDRSRGLAQTVFNTEDAPAGDGEVSDVGNSVEDEDTD